MDRLRVIKTEDNPPQCGDRNLQGHEEYQGHSSFILNMIAFLSSLSAKNAF
jgi:hypothetical protein